MKALKDSLPLPRSIRLADRSRGSPGRVARVAGVGGIVALSESRVVNAGMLRCGLHRGAPSGSARGLPAFPASVTAAQPGGRPRQAVPGLAGVTGCASHRESIVGDASVQGLLRFRTGGVRTWVCCRATSFHQLANGHIAFPLPSVQAGPLLQTLQGVARIAVVEDNARYAVKIMTAEITKFL